MQFNAKKINYTNFWIKLIGEPEKFSMENRAFNFVCIISAFLLFYYLIFDFFFDFYLMSFLNVALLFILMFLYILSRFKKEYKRSINFFALCSYLAIILNYKYDGGIIGPTFFIFFITFYFLIALSPKSMNAVWISSHILVGAGLLYWEYHHPDWIVKNIYPDKLSQYLDVFFTYISVIFIIFLLAGFLRNNSELTRKLAELRSREIAIQHEKIVFQNQQLEKLNAEKNKLFSIISHDLRTPVDSLVGYLGILNQYDINEKERTELETELFKQARYASHLLENLLYWSKTQMHGVKTNIVNLSVKHILHSTSEFKAASAARKHINMEYHVDEDIIVKGDKEMMQIVIRNLINNAIKFTPSQGNINIRVYKSEKNKEGIISVKDTGMGMNKEKKSELFTLQTRSTYGTHNEKGVGLGLLVCKEFMDYQNGKIWVESEEGKGSEFFVALPMVLD